MREHRALLRFDNYFLEALEHHAMLGVCVSAPAITGVSLSSKQSDADYDSRTPVWAHRVRRLSAKFIGRKSACGK